MTLEEKIGSQLVLGITGTTITPEIVEHFKKTHAGGLILFRINMESVDQVKKLISDLETALGRQLLVCVDHEGGRVIMFSKGVTIFPSNQAIGKTGNTKHARFQGEQEAKELRRLGIDVNFAPVIDVLTDAYSPNIGIRAYGSDPTLVANMGAARLSAMQVEGLSAVAKHFPGLGAATRDPHVDLPTIDISWDELHKTHFPPFERAMRTAVHGIMTSHPLYPNLDNTPNTPATFSKKIVREYLREKTGYKGVIFTDDLEMGALKSICPIGESAVRAAEAGHDMFLVCHEKQAQQEVYDALLKAHQSGRLSTKDLDDSVKRIETLKGRRMERFAAAPATELRAKKEQDDAQAIVQTICRESVTVLKSGDAPVPSASTAVIFPRLSSLADKIFVEADLQKETVFIERITSAVGFKPAITLVGIEPSDAEISAAQAASQQAEQTVLFLYDAHALPSNKKLLDAIQGNSKRLTVVLLRDVYDAEYLTGQTHGITNYGFRACDLEAVVQALFQPKAATVS